MSYIHKCEFCGFDFTGRAGAKTCSPRCRQLKKRGRGLMIDTKIEIPPERTSKTDCVIRAISSASGVCYRDVLKMIGPEKGRSKGYPARRYHPVLEQLGFTRIKHNRFLDLSNFDKKHRYFICVRAHAIAIVRGHAIDTWHSTGHKRRRIILEAWIAP